MSAVSDAPRPKLRLDESHTYWLGERVVPSVTQILKLAGAIDDRFYRDEHSLRGTLVHQATELFDEGLLDVVDCDELIRPYLEAWAKFRRETSPKILASESIVYHEGLDYAGTLDRIVRLRGREWVLDIKSGSKVAATKLQTAAYALAVGRPLKRMALYLTDRGTYSVDEHEDRSDRDYWQSMVMSARWIREHNLARKGA